LQERTGEKRLTFAKIQNDRCAPVTTDNVKLNITRLNCDTHFTYLTL